MQSKILTSYISAHHGFFTKENELAPTIKLLQKHTEIDMVEIDFVYDNGKFISSHDYEDENVIKGSELTIWLNEIIPLNKMIWIDIKDSTWSILSESFSKFDVQVLFDLIRSEKKKFNSMNIALEKYILIGCQYEHLIDKIVTINDGEFLLAYDFPRIHAYVTKTIAPACFDMVIDQYYQEESELILNELIKGKYNIVCLDVTFFMSINDIVMLLNKINNISIVIIYSLDLTSQEIISIPGKHVITQYNYSQ